MTMPHFTAHATQRRIEMALTTTEVREAIEDPEVVCPTHSDRLTFKRGRLLVVCDTGMHAIVTILWSGKCKR